MRNRIREHRTARGLNIRQLAELAGVTRPAISYLELAEGAWPQPATLVAICRALKVQPADLAPVLDLTEQKESLV